jgi:predicted 2-oxoglutarate/Fe(II)-dependent dioxygenase YbiX
MKRLLPEEYEILNAYIEVLPGSDDPAFAPFLSIAININVATKAHRDPMDKEICLVLALTNAEGGGLVLHEPGIVVDMKNGDIIIFRSSKITHFNLHYKGSRASIVLHSDQGFDRWVKNRNNWQDNDFFVR